MPRILFLLVLPTTAFATDVCHVAGDGHTERLTVAEAAVAAHVAHGDWRASATDATADGRDDDCDGQIDEDASCSLFDEADLDALLAVLPAPSDWASFEASVEWQRFDRDFDAHVDNGSWCDGFSGTQHQEWFELDVRWRGNLAEANPDASGFAAFTYDLNLQSITYEGQTYEANREEWWDATGGDGIAETRNIETIRGVNVSACGALLVAWAESKGFATKVHLVTEVEDCVVP
ncbi:MAG: hypothetical protein EP330_17050 [Deltaproteobacteria bacterium]|nr:MAG: hypothetical protein EP330_17050 [Deltaproteobacteria bacterium]